MALNKVRFGDYIKLIKIQCGIPNLTPDDVSGINRDKEFFEPSKQVSGDTSNYRIVPPNCFACNIMHVGRDVVLPIALNNSGSNKIVSPAYTVFEWTGDSVLLKEFLFIMLKSTEKDRYFWFHCDSSVRDGMDWNAFCDIELEVPSIDIQRKYVAIYEGLLSNLRSYEKGLDDLKLVCDGYIEQLRRTNNACSIRDLICFRNEKNKDGSIQLEQGIDIGKHFITPQRSNSNLFGRKIVRKGDIAYCSQLNNENVAIAYRDEEDCVVSSVYESFFVKDKFVLNPRYLFLWLRRKEFGRFVYWKSTGTSYEFLDGENIKDMRIPIPHINIQNSIAEIYLSLERRIQIIQKLKNKISSTCPVLIRGSILEAQGGN